MLICKMDKFTTVLNIRERSFVTAASQLSLTGFFNPGWRGDGPSSISLPSFSLHLSVRFAVLTRSPVCLYTPPGQLQHMSSRGRRARTTWVSINWYRGAGILPDGPLTSQPYGTDKVHKSLSTPRRVPLSTYAWATQRGGYLKWYTKSKFQRGERWRRTKDGLRSRHGSIIRWLKPVVKGPPETTGTGLPVDAPLC